MKNKTRNIIGIVLCILSISILIYLFPLTKLLIVIPTTLFFVSLKLKKWIWTIVLNTLTILPLLIILIGLKFPTNKQVVINSEIRYQILDFGQGDYIRNAIESKLGNKRVFLADTVNGIKWLYVKESDFKKLWPELPFEMRKKQYTIKATFKTYELWNGNCSNAILINVQQIDGNPKITK
ncbi:hypothetical protein [Labilibacter marinus]|uniref:hypothetical protein n=1 Tax=Labilibacter marinus TaxID=1477105 RepID=UPI00117A1BFE|nr:hypothetical protein [Labilibacter marinus]